ncbi:MAG TPA: gamma-glutamyl-gamma-aminobutyrate hydrolase family protein, partial [bacterium]|nr:gamma-glutamyl-gamma-aminobutyrate hydrolase family protein [bacterium]
ELKYIDSEELEKDNTPLGDYFEGCSGILVPGGFGHRGIEGKINAVQFARENNIPFFGICLGMQLAVIEFARHVAGLADANSDEFNNKTKNPVISLMAEQKAITNKGATMRLGHYPCVIENNTFAHEAYGERKIFERHRHRYEFNLKYKEQLCKKGLVTSGTSPDGLLVEIIEIKGHPWFLGCQFHPEFQSSPMKPHPIFADFIVASIQFARKKDWINKKEPLNAVSKKRPGPKAKIKIV